MKNLVDGRGLQRRECLQDFQILFVLLDRDEVLLQSFSLLLFIVVFFNVLRFVNYCFQLSHLRFSLHGIQEEYPKILRRLGRPIAIQISSHLLLLATHLIEQPLPRIILQPGYVDLLHGRPRLADLVPLLKYWPLPDLRNDWLHR